MLQVTSPATLDAIKLEQAAELIDRGWCKGDFQKEVNGVNHYCALGALVWAEGGDFNSATRRLCRVIGTEFGADIAYFNDHIARSASDVSAVLRKAAEIARGEV